jgi:phage shock protein PspC (stress-responsive transcriptional regulator)
VCGGLGRATNVDPIVYRVLAVILTFFAGAGLLLYALGWLLLPEDRSGVSLSERALGRARARRDSSDRAGAIALTALLVLVAAIAVGGVVNSWTATVLVLLVVGGIFLLLRRDGGTVVAAAPSAAAAAPGVGTTMSYSTPTPGAAGTQTAPLGASPLDAGHPSTQAGPAGPSGPGAPAAPSYADFGPPPPPARQPKPTSVLGPLTVSVLLISLGVLAAVDASGASIPAAAYPALALLVIGLGLLVGTWYGRSRALIALGIVAALALPPTIAADVFDRGEFRRGGADQHVSVADVGDIRDRYGFRPGRAELDLTPANFSGRTIRTHLEMPAGELQVLVPQNVDVVATVDLAVGDSRVLGRESSGLGISDRVEDLGADGRGGGALELRIEQGVGSVEVQREAA